jgi:CubicO group peptidase (beta-lactamase class C family)
MTRTAEELGFDSERLARVDALLHRYVDDGKLPGTILQVARHGEVAHTDVYGWADVAARRPLAEDAIVRLYSMTKPITSVALMMLYEEGEVLLDNPVSRFIPEFAEARVYAGDGVEPVPVTRRVTVHDMLTHMGGVTQGFMPGPVGAMYRDAGLGDLVRSPNADLEEACARIGRLPLVSQPGERWNYGHSTDVVGRIVEVVSGKPFDDFCRTRIFDPLGMVDTDFWCPPEKTDRLAASYWRTATERMRLADGSGAESRRRSRPRFLSGAGGLLSTLADYHRFTDMLRRGGARDGARILSPRTLAFMTRNHLPGGRTLGDDAVFLEPARHGVGFGLGFAVVLDAAQTHQLCSPGEYYWGGAASTVFWVDPVEDLTVIFLTQLLPSSTYPLRPALRAGVYQALVGR